MKNNREIRIKQIKKLLCAVVLSAVFLIILVIAVMNHSGSELESGYDLPLSSNSAEESSETTRAEKPKEIKQLDIEAIQDQNDELVFSFLIDDFIDSFNGYYYEEYDKSFLSPAEDWVSFTYDEPPHSKFPSRYYRFQEDVKNFNEPTISVYVPQNSRYVQEITLDFNEHGYTNWGYEIYEKNCFYTLKVFFPDYDDEKISMIYSTIYDKAYDSDCYINMENSPSPKVLYYKGNIAIYPYYRGGMIHLALIPVTQQYLDGLASNNIEIYEIDKL